MTEQLTVTRLERLLEAKRARLEGLLQQRDKLEKKLELLNRKIAALDGRRSEGAAPVRTRRRPRNEKPLLQVVLELLAKHKKGLLLNDLSAKVLETGYKTNSTNFANTLYQCLYNNSDQITCDTETRLYKLAPPTA